MKLPRRKVFVRALLILVAVVVTPIVAVVVTRTNIEQESLIAEAASGVTDITSIVSSGSSFSYNAESCGGQLCK